MLSLILDAQATETLTALRTAYFPAHRNHLNAHITLFHALPPSEQLFTLLESTLKDTKQFNIGLGDPFLFKNETGVALNLKSFKAIKLHEELSNALYYARVNLTEQDSRQMRSLHVTVCNKEKPEKAKDIMKEVQGKMEQLKKDMPVVKGLGVKAWEYLPDASWKPIKEYLFK